MANLGVMQLGVIGAVPLVAALALVTHRIRLAAYAALAGGTIYLVAKLVKAFVQRGRPQTLLEDVYIFDIPDRGLGYVSGHSAVAFALATVASPFLGRRARRVAWTLAGLVCVARIYVGSHLPLDVVGGAALGGAAGALVLLVFGAPTGHPSLARGPCRPAGLRVRSGRPGDRGHDRIEHRGLKAVSVRHLGFPHAAQVIQVTHKTRDLHANRWRTETVYATTNLPFESARPARLADLLRGHWAIEALHIFATPPSPRTPPRSAPARPKCDGLPAQPGDRAAQPGGTGQRRRCAPPPRPRPTPTPRHPGDQPQMNPTSTTAPPSPGRPPEARSWFSASPAGLPSVGASYFEPPWLRASPAEVRLVGNFGFSWEPGPSRSSGV